MTAQLSLSISSHCAFVEPLFVVWLDIVYNEHLLVDLFKCLCYFSPYCSAIHLSILPDSTLALLPTLPHMEHSS